MTKKETAKFIVQLIASINTHCTGRYKLRGSVKREPSGIQIPEGLVSYSCCSVAVQKAANLLMFLKRQDFTRAGYV